MNITIELSGNIHGAGPTRSEMNGQIEVLDKLIRDKTLGMADTMSLLSSRSILVGIREQLSK